MVNELVQSGVFWTIVGVIVALVIGLATLSKQNNQGKWRGVLWGFLAVAVIGLVAYTGIMLGSSESEEEEPTQLEEPTSGPSADEPLYLQDFYGDISQYQKISPAAVGASSELVSGGITYSAKKAIDNSLETSWQEGVEGYGLGESITVNFSKSETVAVIVVHPGFAARDYFVANGRPKRIDVAFSNGEHCECSFTDSNQDFYFELSKPVQTSYVRLTIEEVYEGQWHEDTCISEIAFYTN